MKVQLRDLVEAVPALDRIKGQKPKDVKLGYAVARNIQKIERKLNEPEGYNEKRNDLVFKHGEPNKEGMVIVPTGTKKMLAFNKELDALMDGEVEMDLWVLNLTKIQQAGVELTIDDYTRLLFMAELGEEEPEAANEKPV
jgi:hypothetical protein